MKGIKMDIKEILENNKQVEKEYKHQYSIVEKEKKVLQDIEKRIISPCKFCSQEGFYRCEACESDMYRGFNDPDYLDKF